MDKKLKTIKTYSLLAHELGEGYDEYFRQVVQPEADKFLSNIPKNGKILDAGCGIGTHSLYFKSKGYNVVPIDLSLGMVEICKSKGLDAVVMDLENLQFEDSSFDGIWCHTSLIHFDNKDKIRAVLRRFSQILKPNSPLFIALREGRGEKWELYHDAQDTERWFLYFEQGEFEKYIPSIFIKAQVGTTEYKNHRFLNYHLLIRE
jgi:SAM-dependent methyltransferase